MTLVFGLLTIVLLLGYGLVEIPIQYFNYASLKRSLTSYHIKVAEYDDKLREKAKKVQTLIEIINEVSVESSIEQYKEILIVDVENFQSMI